MRNTDPQILRGRNHRGRKQPATCNLKPDTRKPTPEGQVLIKNCHFLLYFSQAVFRPLSSFYLAADIRRQPRTFKFLRKAKCFWHQYFKLLSALCSREATLKMFRLRLSAAKISYLLWFLPLTTQNRLRLATDHRLPTTI